MEDSVWEHLQSGHACKVVEGCVCNTYRVVMLDRLWNGVGDNTYITVMFVRLWKAVSGNTYRVVILVKLW